jgi:hypothetical protein
VGWIKKLWGGETMKKTIILIVVAFLSLLALIPAVNKGPKEILFARTTLHVSWDISNKKTVGPAKGFNEDIPIALTSKDLARKELTLMFCGVGETEVTYTTRAGGREVKATVKFKVKKYPGDRKTPDKTSK